MTKIWDKILSHIEKYNMIKDNDTVILAVSGGADSMCMLHFFKEYSRNHNINIICAHVNHGIRGEEADSDEAFVRDFCKRNDITFECAHYDVPAISRETGESEEECGRRLRYEFFKSLNADAKIATAHNLNDSMETVIFNFARGTSLKGLTGIPAVRENIIRPVLCLEREEIVQYNQFYCIDYVTDSTNLIDEYSRNKIRHNIIPVMNELNGGFAKVFTGCVESLNVIEDYLDGETRNIYNRINQSGRFSVDELNKLHSALRDRIIIKICENAGAYDISRRHVELINSILVPGGAVMLHGGVKICSDGKYLFKQTEKAKEISIFEPVCPDNCEYIFDRVLITLIDVDKSIINNYNIKNMSMLGFADGEKIFNAVFRSRKPGDRFKFPYAEHSKSLKNLYKEKNISPESRVGVPLIADGENILWINGVGVSDYAKVTADTKKIVRIVISESVKGEKDE